MTVRFLSYNVLKYYNVYVILLEILYGTMTVRSYAFR
jgi:hypothetical protein